MTYVNFHLRHRLYFSGIFLGHDDEAEARLPFYSWELIDFRARYNSSFRRDNYRLLFERYFPKLAAIPHCSEVALPEPAGERRSRHLRGWSLALLGTRLNPRRPDSAIRCRKLLRRLPSGLFLGQRYQTELRFLRKIHLFEARLRRAGVKLDWSAI